MAGKDSDCSDVGCGSDDAGESAGGCDISARGEDYSGGGIYFGDTNFCQCKYV